MTPGDPTEQLPQVGGSSAGSSGSSSVPKFPMRPEDVDKARADAKAAKEAAKEAEARAARETAAAPKAPAASPSMSAPAGATRPAGPAAGPVAGGGGAPAAGGAGAVAGAAVARPAGSAPARPAGTSAPRPTAKAAVTAAPGSGRRVRLTLSRIDPWSALKMSFLLSVALGIAMVVATAALWLILAGMGAFDQVNNLIGQIIQDGEKKFDIMDFVGFGRVVSLSIVFAVIDVFLITAIATLGAFIYNVSSSLVGGLHLTLTDD